MAARPRNSDAYGRIHVRLVANSLSVWWFRRPVSLEVPTNRGIGTLDGGRFLLKDNRNGQPHREAPWRMSYVWGRNGAGQHPSSVSIDRSFSACSPSTAAGSPMANGGIMRSLSNPDAPYSPSSV